MSVNGFATMIEAGTGRNFMRDELFGKILMQDEDIYYNYETVTELIMSVGTLALGIYHMTGRYKAAKYGQKFLGKSYKRAENGRWVSKDGLRQLRLDTTGHLYNGKPSKSHFNAEYFKTNYWQNKRVPIKRSNLHIFYDFFSMWVE